MPRSPRRRRYPNANGDVYTLARANRVARVFRRAAAAMPDGYPRPARNSHAHAPTHRHAYALAYRDAHAPPYAYAASPPYAHAYAASATYAHAYAYAPTYRHAAAPIDRAGEPRGGRRARAA